MLLRAFEGLLRACYWLLEAFRYFLGLLRGF